MPPARLGFPSSCRLRKKADFQRLMRSGEKLYTPHFKIVRAAGAAAESRLGIAVNKSIGGAVRRNRLKRRLREFFRLNRCRFSSPVDVFIIAKNGAAELDFQQISTELEEMFR